MRVAVTGAGGRLGRALVDALAGAPFTGLSGPIAWMRERFDLDRPEAFAELLDRDRPEAIVHAAAWTDVDGCARDPELAMRRNAEATRVLAGAAAERGLDLIVVSTNEVFDGRTTDHRGYGPAHPPNPINPYGESKLAGERAAGDAFARASGQLGIVRTAWLFGPPGNDFPEKILAAAERAKVAGEPLRVVVDEVGSPTYSVDVAEAIVELVGSGEVGGVHHIVNSGVAPRAAWAEEVLRQAGRSMPIDGVPASTWSRPSRPPRWAVLAPTPLPSGEPLRSWQGATADYMPALLRQHAAHASASR